MVLDEMKYVDQAERVIQRLLPDKDNNEINKTMFNANKSRNTFSRKKNSINKVEMITTSKLRNLLALSADIYNEILVLDEELPEEIVSRIQYLRIRFVYECGRDENVKSFVKEAHILDALQEIQGSRKRFQLFNHYMEALVAFHRYYGGKDK